MNFENLENIISLFCNIVGLLLCVFKYNHGFPLLSLVVMIYLVFQYGM